MEPSNENAMQRLVDEFFCQIEVVYTNFDPCHQVGDYGSDAAEMAITVPDGMLSRYSELKGVKEPEGAEFWKETKLAKRLREYNGKIPAEHANMFDVLDFLGGEVQVSYRSEGHGRTRIDISETG